ncbi:hypothetical protein GUJ93_ZPchr0003g16446 [Zizania palustris]|uniref:Calcineurin-like phosphoesterase domain-containing protein n=1 Tax=Zizania palustris TaxID=103762 RepID=A0A8J5VXH3_ZIZPA|nr:hypothetical protein GUJ93_ZPchr0003g16446 [Zizania palustris]
MKIAVEGCMHGELDKVYDTLRQLEEAEGVKIDLLLCCGDFQAVRNENDLQCVNVKPKYRTMNSFWKYYSGKAVAPYPTIFIGGNHEASNYLWELYYGGWAAPNIYFLGLAGVVKFGNIRIGGLSGIHKQQHYQLGHYERPPYNEGTIRSVYHVRHYDVLKLMHVKEPLDIFMSHDWPLGITEYGNWQKLIREKRFFEEEVIQTCLQHCLVLEILDMEIIFSYNLRGLSQMTIHTNLVRMPRERVIFLSCNIVLCIYGKFMNNVIDNGLIVFMPLMW